MIDLFSRLVSSLIGWQMLRSCFLFVPLIFYSLFLAQSQNFLLFIYLFLGKYFAAIKLTISFFLFLKIGTVSCFLFYFVFAHILHPFFLFSLKTWSQNRVGACLYQIHRRDFCQHDTVWEAINDLTAHFNTSSRLQILRAPNPGLGELWWDQRAFLESVKHFQLLLLNS